MDTKEVSEIFACIISLNPYIDSIDQHNRKNSDS